MTSTYCLFAGKYGSTPPTVSVKQKMDRCIEAHIRGRSRQLSVLMSNTDIQKRACQRQAESVTKISGIKKIKNKSVLMCCYPERARDKFALDSMCDTRLVVTMVEAQGREKRYAVLRARPFSARRERKMTNLKQS